jgi:DNA-binding XRE family transcriptional regulator
LYLDRWGGAIIASPTQPDWRQATVLSDHPFAERVHRLRDEADLTQYDLAKAADIRPETVSRIENGKVTDPAVSIVIRLARVFAERLERPVTVGYLVGVENGEPAEPKVAAG